MEVSVRGAYLGFFRVRIGIFPHTHTTKRSVLILQMILRLHANYGEVNRMQLTFVEMAGVELYAILSLCISKVLTFVDTCGPSNTIYWGAVSKTVVTLLVLPLD